MIAVQHRLRLHMFPSGPQLLLDAGEFTRIEVGPRRPVGIEDPRQRLGGLQIVKQEVEFDRKHGFLQHETGSVVRV